MRLVAILRDIQPDDICSIIDALIKAEIKELEISLSNKAIGYQTIEKALANYKGKIRIGAGTVTNVNQIQYLKSIGIDFIITPAYDQKLVDAAINQSIEIIPGVFTPQDVMYALSSGIEVLKLFPWDALSNNYIKSLKGPFPNAKFMAVGGVDCNNLLMIKELGFIGVAPGSDLVKRGATVADADIIYTKAMMYQKVLNDGNV